MIKINDLLEKENWFLTDSTLAGLQKKILEKNSTMDAMKIFVKLSGIEPVVEPLLKSRGIN